MDKTSTEDRIDEFQHDDEPSDAEKSSDVRELTFEELRLVSGGYESGGCGGCGDFA